MTMTRNAWISAGVFLLVAVRLSRTQLPWFVDSSEGTSCTLPDGSAGVCRQTHDCRMTVVLVGGSGQLSAIPNRDGGCGSVGPGSLVCCRVETRVPVTNKANKTATTATTTTTTTTAAPATLVTSPPNFPEREKIRVGEVSTRYCLEHIGFNRRRWWPFEREQNGRQERPRWWEEDNTITSPEPTVFNAPGGEKTYHREFPHLALLGYLAPGHVSISWSCGGTLISDRFVLTAAHCFTDNILGAPVAVRLGEYDLAANDRTEQDFGIQDTWTHPQYDPQLWYHDIALVRLKKQVAFNDAIRPACLSTRPEGWEREEGLVTTGWGSTSIYGYSSSNVLLKGRDTLNVVRKNQCAKFFGRSERGMPNGVQDGMLCAIDSMGDSNICVGGSGNPIQLPTAFDVYVVTGIAVSENSYCESRTPSIYTRVSYYLAWIESVVWPNE